MARGKELIVGILCRFCFGGAEFSGENGLAGIVAYRSGAYERGVRSVPVPPVTWRRGLGPWTQTEEYHPLPSGRIKSRGPDLVASKLGFRILVGIQDAVFKRDMKHCIRGRQAPAIKKKIPWYALRQGEDRKRGFSELVGPIDRGAEFSLKEARHSASGG